MGLTPLLLLLSQLTGNVYLKFGSDPQLNYYNHKYLAIGYVEPLNGIFDHQFEIGGWNARYHSERTSAYVSYQTGLRTKGNFYSHVFTGVALHTSPDSRLSSMFQFKHDFGIGIKDERNVGIGIDYSHISNAGITMPNLGRDSILIRAEIPFN